MFRSLSTNVFISVFAMTVVVAMQWGILPTILAVVGWVVIIRLMPFRWRQKISTWLNKTFGPAIPQPRPSHPGEVDITPFLVNLQKTKEPEKPS